MTDLEYSGSLKRDLIRLFIISFIIIFSFALYSFATRANYDAQGNLLCSEYSNTPLKDVPMRCVKGLSK